MKTPKLTVQEEQVLRLVLAEKSVNQIALALSLSPAQIQILQNSISTKLGTTHLVGYIRYALEHQILIDG